MNKYSHQSVEAYSGPDQLSGSNGSLCKEVCPLWAIIATLLNPTLELPNAIE